MSFKDFKVVEAIGKGSFASVYKVVRKSDNKVYALKRVKINKMSKKEIADALNEIRFLASIRHKNIVGFLEAFLEADETELCIVMEYCGCGDLAQKVDRYKRRRQYIDETVIWRYLVQCLKALQNLHEKGICHRDLKAANTFLAEDGSVKIGDMNVSKRLQKGQLQTQIGTPYYMAPEIWNNRPYDSSADIWALGCLIYELASLKPPFTGDCFPALKRNILSGRYPPIPRKYTDGLHKVVGQMLSLNARNRPSATAMLTSADFVVKLELDDIVTSFGAKPLHKPSSELIETIKVPLGNNLRRLGGVLPKPCYPDVRPNSPSSWTVAEQEKQRPQQHAVPHISSHVSSSVASSNINTYQNKGNDTDRTERSDNSYRPIIYGVPPPKAPLQAITENNHNIPRSVYNPHQQAPQKISHQVSHQVPTRGAAPVVRKYPPPPLHQPSGPIISQVPGSYNRGRQVQAPTAPPTAAPVAGHPVRLAYRRIW